MRNTEIMRKLDELATSIEERWGKHPDADLIRLANERFKSLHYSKGKKED